MSKSLTSKHHKHDYEKFIGRWDICLYPDQLTYPFGINNGLWMEVNVDREGNVSIIYQFLFYGVYYQLTPTKEQVFPVADISINDDILKFTVYTNPDFFGFYAPVQIFTGKYVKCGSKPPAIIGQVYSALDIGLPLTYTWVAFPAPDWIPYSPDEKLKYGTPVNFTNSSLPFEEQWDPRFYGSGLAGWELVDGVLSQTELDAGIDIFTRESFNDFKFSFYFKFPDVLEPDSYVNGGFFLRGRYEIQITNDNSDPPMGNMAIYGRVQPLSFPPIEPGAWNKVEGLLIGNNLTMTLNGILVHDHVLIEGTTGQSLDSYEAAPGPILLQAHAANTLLSFKEIIITPVYRVDKCGRIHETSCKSCSNKYESGKCIPQSDPQLFALTSAKALIKTNFVEQKVLTKEDNSDLSKTLNKVREEFKANGKSLLEPVGKHKPFFNKNSLAKAQK